MTLQYQEILSHFAAKKADFEKLFKELRDMRIPEDAAFAEFFNQYRQRIIKGHEYATVLAQDPQLKSVSIEKLQELNQAYFAKLHPETGYPTSIANPDYAAQLYGNEMGALLSALYTNSFGILYRLQTNNYFSAKGLLEIFFQIWEKKDAPNYEEWVKIYRDEVEKDMDIKVRYGIYERYSPQARFYFDIVYNSELSDNRYLYRYGTYLSEYDLAMADFMRKYPKEDIEHLAEFFVQSWIDGFIRAQKDYRKKKYANVMIPVGMEALGRLIIDKLEARGIQALMPMPHSNGINRQFGYDHRYDSALTLDRQSLDSSLKIYAEAYEELQELFALQAGPLYLELFGEQPFSPESKSTTLKLSDEQQGLLRERSAKLGELINRYYKRDESSFSIISLPSLEIGEKFPEIFADTMKINLLDSKTYARIQQNIIDVLDTADYVHIKGKAGNDTDIKVKMHKITDPEKETLFENCVADVNIPVGEVFTSPVLEGTNGTLHVEDIYLESLRYFNLKITFEDGWVKDYSCTNYSDMEEGKRYIHENLLLPHETLPIGEFAIGTNTTAYQIAKKHDIMHLLPILIIEKMGPHFAIGDTCYSHEEDSPHPSFYNGKEMIAVDNEKSILRKTEPLNAYLMAHTDITLPYEMLEFIAVVKHDGTREDIIRNGRFVVPGTEELNIPLDEMDSQ